MKIIIFISNKDQQSSLLDHPSTLSKRTHRQPKQTNTNHPFNLRYQSYNPNIPTTQSSVHPTIHANHGNHANDHKHTNPNLTKHTKHINHTKCSSNQPSPSTTQKQSTIQIYQPFNRPTNQPYHPTIPTKQSYQTTNHPDIPTIQSTNQLYQPTIPTITNQQTPSVHNPN
jgi:hypothetical protein